MTAEKYLVPRYMCDDWMQTPTGEFVRYEAYEVAMREIARLNELVADHEESARDRQPPPSSNQNVWPEFDDFAREAMRDKARPRIAQRTETYGHMSDEWVANRVRMLYRDDLEHEAICSAARDRIMRLSIEVAELRGILAAKRADETSDGPWPDDLAGDNGKYIQTLSLLRKGGYELETRLVDNALKEAIRVLKERRAQKAAAEPPVTMGALKAANAVLDDVVAERDEAERKVEQLEKDLEKELEERDRNADYADQLTNMIGVYFETDHGEHSNLNEPWENAIETMRVAIGTKQSSEKTSPTQGETNG